MVSVPAIYLLQPPPLLSRTFLAPHPSIHDALRKFIDAPWIAAARIHHWGYLSDDYGDEGSTSAARNPVSGLV